MRGSNCAVMLMLAAGASAALEPPAQDGPVARTYPGPGACIAISQPRIQAELREVLEPADVSISVDDADLTLEVMVVGSIASVLLQQPLRPGIHNVRLWARGTTLTWTFSYEPVPSAAEQAPAAARADWSLNALGILTLIGTKDELESTARLRLNSRAEMQGDGWYVRENVDLGLRQNLRGGSGPVQESRNYLIDAGVRGRGGFGAQGLVGFFYPDFLDQSQLFAMGLARGGVEGKLISPVGAVSAYRSYDTRPAGIVAGSFGPAQAVWAGSLQTPLIDRRFEVRLIGLWAENDPGVNTVGGKGFVLGALGKATLSPAATLLLEAARGKYIPNAGGPDPTRAGDAFRLGVIGAIESWSYVVNVRQTDRDFVNPTNRGFAPGAGSDRSGGDATVTKLFGNVVVGGTYRHLSGGGSSGFISSSAHEDGGYLFCTVPLGSAATLSTLANLSWNRQGTDEAHGLTRTNQLVWGGTLIASERLGRVTLSESYGYQSIADRVSSTFNQKIHSATLSAFGPVITNLILSAFASVSQANLANGNTDQISLSIQPTYLVPPLWMTLQPRVAYSSVENSAVQLDTKTEQLQLLASWEPPWFRSLFAVQAAGDWSRSSTSGVFSPPTFRFLTNLVFRASAGSGALAPAASPLPVGPAFAAPLGLDSSVPGWRR